jgi:hypothetical protein
MNNNKTNINSDNNDLDYEFEELDTSWINEFEELDKDFNSYYKEDLSFIRINYIYINTQNEIVNISEENCLFKKPGMLSKEELIGLIKRNSFNNAIKYSLLSLLKYNIDFEPINLKTFLRSNDKGIGKNYLKSITNIDNIFFEQSISLFHDLNNLFIIFIEKEQKEGEKEKAMTNAFTNPSIINRQLTKKVYIHSNFKKRTKRNLFKDIT